MAWREVARMRNALRWRLFVRKTSSSPTPPTPPNAPTSSTPATVSKPSRPPPAPTPPTTDAVAGPQAPPRQRSPRDPLANVAPEIMELSKAEQTRRFRRRLRNAALVAVVVPAAFYGVSLLEDPNYRPIADTRKALEAARIESERTLSEYQQKMRHARKLPSVAVEQTESPNTVDLPDEGTLQVAALSLVRAARERLDADQRARDADRASIDVLQAELAELQLQIHDFRAKLDAANQDAQPAGYSGIAKSALPEHGSSALKPLSSEAEHALFEELREQTWTTWSAIKQKERAIESEQVRRELEAVSAENLQQEFSPREERIAALSEAAAELFTVAELHGKERRTAEKALRLVESAQLLQARVIAGESFAEELHKLEELAQVFREQAPLLNVALEQLPPSVKASGVSAKADLANSFGAAISQARKVSLVRTDAGSLWHYLLSALIYHVRLPYARDKLVDGESVDARLCRAEYYMRHARIEEAVRELQAVDGVPRTVLSDWLERASEYLRVKRASELLVLESSLVARQAWR